VTDVALDFTEKLIFKDVSNATYSWNLRDTSFHPWNKSL